MSYFDDNEKDNDKYPGSDDDEDTNNSDSEIGDDVEDQDEEQDEDQDEEQDEDLEENEDEDEGEAKGRDEEDSDGESINMSENEGENEGEELYQAKSVSKKKNIKTIIKKNAVNKAFIENLSDDDDDDGETYLKKFDKEINDNYIVNNHPECALQNYDEILAMTKVVRDKNNIIIDDLHKTIPHLTKYERARILGQRAKQIETGATPFIKVPENVIDGYIIAEMELKQGRIPFIIRRPLPNGGSEYWKISDLENIAF